MAFAMKLEFPLNQTRMKVLQLPLNFNTIVMELRLRNVATATDSCLDFMAEKESKKDGDPVFDVLP